MSRDGFHRDAKARNVRHKVNAESVMVLDSLRSCVNLRRLRRIKKVVAALEDRVDKTL